MSKSSYEVAKWYIGFIKVPEHRIKPKQLHKKWNKNGNIEGTYNGYVLINKRDGYGTMHYDNDNIYKGDWKDDKKHGKGILIKNNEEKINGKWIEDKLEVDFDSSKPKYVSKPWNGEGEYKGTILKNKRHGQGKMEYKDGHVYDGEWYNDSKHGKGILKYPNKSEYLTYDAQFENEKFNGNGKLSYKNGSIYEGEFKNGERDGKGKYIYPNSHIYRGTIYEGYFKDDKKHGTGKMIYKSGNIYEGIWKDDKLDNEYIGIWRCINSD